MTTDEMRKKMSEYCVERCCDDCILHRKKIPVCFNVKDEDIIKSNYEIIFGKTKFTRDDLKPCMVVKLRDDSELYIVTESKEGFVLTSLYGHMSLNSYNEDMLCVSGYNSDRGYDIIEVYSLRDTNYHANEISIDKRDLLYKRTEPSPRDIKIKELQDKMDAIKREMDELK